MLFFVFRDGHYVGTVIAADEAEARERAEEKFGPSWGLVEIKPRLPKRVHKNATTGPADPALHP